MAYPTFYTDIVSRNLKEKGQAGSALTGTIAAGLAADGAVWTLRYPEAAVQPAASAFSKRLYVQRIEVVVTTVVAFTTSVTAGRHLKLCRATAPAGTANPSGGAAYVMARKRSDGATTNGETLGVGRVATTAALTMTGFTLGDAIRRLPLTGVGAAGAVASSSWVFDGTQADPIYLLPGEAVVLAAGALMDAAGTFEVSVDVDAVEVP